MDTYASLRCKISSACVCAQVNNCHPNPSVEATCTIVWQPSSQRRVYPYLSDSYLQLRRARSCCDDARNSEQCTHSKCHRMALAVAAARRAATVPIPCLFCGQCADTRRVTFGSPSVGSLRCTGRTAWLERRRQQAGHTLLDDVFPIFMALVELFGEAPADIQARGSLLQHLVPRAHAQDQRCECAVGSYWALPLDRRCKVPDASFASGPFFHQERKNHLADAVVLSGDQRREHPLL